ncbi:MAG: lytic transglycosylase domain-containing protein [Acidobacteria bacterium]|jgi:soluble lytic murein transglycosylase-like protein|nr:lytic transglycosylase domain-containing protein [Acidobacteriota bacterium]
MIRNEQASRSNDVGERRLRPVPARPREHQEPRAIVIRQGSGWQSLAVFLLCLLLLTVVLLGHQAVKRLESQNQERAAAMARATRKIQQLEASLGFDSARRQLLLGMRNQILKTNPRVSLADAYRYAELALEASEKYPAVDPLLLLAIGIVESGFNPQAKSPADARGLYQIWPSTGRILVRALGWDYDDATLYDPEINTQAAAFYLDVLFATYDDPQLVLAEYNGGPLNAGYFRASVRALAPETRRYVPRVLELYGRLKEEFESGIDVRAEPSHRDAGRQGKKLGSSTGAGNGKAAGPSG